MTDKANATQRLKKARELKQNLEAKLEKVKGTPREGEFQIQIDKLDELIAHLEGELEN
jgi:hypothetical protein